MAPQLPWELEEEILSRLPLRSLGRFRTVCKRWNGVCKDKTFQNNHLSRSRPQFIFVTNSRSYSIDIINPNSNAPKLELRDLHSFIVTPRDYTTITTCDELLFCNDGFGKNETALWNPWLRQVIMIPRKQQFDFFGLGYDNSKPEKVYKILGFFRSFSRFSVEPVIYDCASHAFRFIKSRDSFTSETARRTILSLNGNLYWFECYTHEYFIRRFDFSTENFEQFCHLPCQKNHPRDQLLLAVYKRDGFSLLKQCDETRKVEIWVTNKIDQEEVVWIKLMTLTSSNLPRLSNVLHGISYFIYDKTLFMCYGDEETRVAWIYIVRGDKCKKIEIDYDLEISECLHFVSTPSFISVPLFSG